jgi:NADPH-dependent curcumin reductase CurA
MNTQPNRRIVLARRPNGAPVAADFRLETDQVPEAAPDQVLLRTLYLSLDPYMRGRMNDAPSYAPPVALGEVMVGATVSRVVASRHPDYKPGQLVLADAGWQDYISCGVRNLMPLALREPHPSRALGVLGMPGFTAYMGLLDIGKPQSGETVVVAAASGAVGSVVGQIAKIQGCRVVGIAGGENKCSYVVDELGFDACIDHQTDDLPRRLAAACPQGIDVYFESVGGPIFDAVLPLLNTRARVPVCGLVSQYNRTEPPTGPDRLGLLMSTVLRKRMRVQGFIIWQDYGMRWEEFHEPMSAWLEQDRIKVLEDIVPGLENAPEALISLLEGHNFGKVVVKVASNV